MIMRRFVRSATLLAFVAGSLTACKEQTVPPPDSATIAALTITAQPGTPSQQAAQGTTELGLATPRDGWLYVPTNYNHATPTPLVVLLHGANGSANNWDATFQYKTIADSYGVVLLAIDSRYPTWDAIQTPFFGVDVEFLNDAMEFVFDRVNVDPQKISISGFSDGASEAIGIGIANAGLFSRVLAHSPGLLLAPFARGVPRILITAGEDDDVIQMSSTTSVVSSLRVKGFTVEYTVYPNTGHTIPLEARLRAFDIMIQDQ